MALGAEFPEVLAAAQTGADWAVAVIYRDVNPLLVRYLRARAPSVAEDLASEVWLAAAPKLAGFTGDESGLRAWLFTIARRRLVDHRRRTGRRPSTPHDPATISLLEGSRPEGPFVGGAGARGSDPADTVVTRLSAQESVDLLTRWLTDDQAEVVMLRVIAGLEVAEVAEVAEVMGRAKGWVRVTQHRALERLAERLAPEVAGATSRRL